VQNFVESKIPLRIWELEEVKVDKLLERLEKVCEKVEKPPIVCIDYLQLLSGGNENTKNALDEALRKIFNFRRKTNTTFIIISSLNRMNYNTEISYESFKETGTIEYSADVIWGLQLLLSERTAARVEAAKKEIPRQVQLKCLKNRFGSNYDVGFLYYPNADVFLEMEEYGEYTDYRKNESGTMVEVNKSRKKKVY
jgi:replicative DNA helicase